MLRSCVLDVGANHGDFSLELAARVPDMPILALEPIPELFAALKTKQAVLGLQNMLIEQVAAHEQPGSARFNVARHADWGVSSLLEFDTQNLKANEYWAQRSDLFFEDTIEVERVRLDQLLLKHGFSHVSFIKIDAQGVDLQVLASLGDFLSQVDGGMLEAPTTRRSGLYQGEPVLHEVLDFLRENKLEPYLIKPNDPGCAEVNVYFVRVGVVPDEMEARLKLKGLRLYDGRHYWHVPSANPEPPSEAEAPLMMTELSRARHVIAENEAAWMQVQHWKNQALAAQEQTHQIQHEYSSWRDAHALRLREPLRQIYKKCETAK